MVVHCEQCEARQPIDWRSGDLCVLCGGAVREEVRCFWCFAWVPSGKFCRDCGAAAVPHEQYGAARMLKHMGASVFEVPRLLKELDPGQIETHSAIYARHRAVAERHIDDLRYLEPFLYHKHWSAELEDELLRLMPFEKHWLNGKHWERNAKEIAANAPLQWVRSLAEIARLQQGDITARQPVELIFHGSDGRMREEAVLALTSWRILGIHPLGRELYPYIDALRACSLRHESAPRLRLLSKDAIDLPQDSEPFLTALVHGHSAVFENELRSPDLDRRVAAAIHLIRLGRHDVLAPLLFDLDPDRQLVLLRELKGPVRLLHDALFHILENGESKNADFAARLIASGASHQEAMKLIDLTNANARIVHILFHSRLASETYFSIGELLVLSERFDADAFGYDSAAKPGNMPAEFVPVCYPRASDKMRQELLQFAEKQVMQTTPGASLPERVLVRACFVPGPADLRKTAWSCMYRITMRREYASPCPFPLTESNVRWCFEMREFLICLHALLHEEQVYDGGGIRDEFMRFLHSAEPAFFAAAALECPDYLDKLIATLRENESRHSYLRYFADGLAAALA